MAKPNMALEKVPMPERDPKERATCFEEVATGYTPEMAMEEATRCLNCKAKPCVAGCPVGVRIPEFIQQMAAGNFLEAYQIITSTNSLPAVCGRVCPQESQCEGKCVRGKKGQPVGIGRLERFAADYAREHGNLQAKPVAPNGHKVAVVGGGPAGLTCAGDLARLGYQVTVFEAFQVAGGVLMYGIPEFRLPKSIVQKEVKTLEELGVEIRPNMVIGKILSIDELMEEVKNHEPTIALDGKKDGLLFYKKICSQANDYLNENGKIYFEIGYDQGGAVKELLKENHFKNIHVLKDLSGLDRMVIAGKE